MDHAAVQVSEKLPAIGYQTTAEKLVGQGYWMDAGWPSSLNRGFAKDELGADVRTGSRNN